MTFKVERNWIELIGKIWLPAVTGAQRRDLTKSDMLNIGEPTRENIEQWLACNSGDFQCVTDFSAVIGKTVIEWQDSENQYIYNDCVYGNEMED